MSSHAKRPEPWHCSGTHLRQGALRPWLTARGSLQYMPGQNHRSPAPRCHTQQRPATRFVVDRGRLFPMVSTNPAVWLSLRPFPASACGGGGEAAVGTAANGLPGFLSGQGVLEGFWHIPQVESVLPGEDPLAMRPRAGSRFCVCRPKVLQQWSVRTDTLAARESTPPVVGMGAPAYTQQQLSGIAGSAAKPDGVAGDIEPCGRCGGPHASAA